MEFFIAMLALILGLIAAAAFIAGIVTLIILVIKVSKDKPVKKTGITAGSLIGGSVITFILMFALTFALPGEENTVDTIASDSSTEEEREYEGVEVDGMSDEEIDETIKKARESEGIDKSQYEEADLGMLYNNEYEKQTSLKVSDATVFAIEPSDEEYGSNIGNIVYAEVDDDPVILHDPVGRSDIEKGGTYTFYGPPDSHEKIGLILIDFDK